MEILICPHCKCELEAEDIEAGDAIDCPDCGKTFYIERSPKVRKARKNTQKNKTIWPCYFLGAVLGPIGIFIAQATDGQNGARSARRGMFLMMIVALAILALALAFVNLSRAGIIKF